MAWTRLEKFMHLTLREHGLNEPWTGSRLTKQLDNLDLGPHFIEVANNLRRLRNQVTHDRNTNVSTKGALDYIDAAERLADALVIAQRRRP
jgi:hypothetical protein